MQRKPDSRGPLQSKASSRCTTRQIRRFHSSKIPYRVGYNWNKAGRLNELRIRSLARKFLKIWIQNTVGRIRPHEANTHYRRVNLRRAFEGWREEWWTSRREWSLTLRAECHYRYYLFNLVFDRWKTLISLQKEKKSKIRNAQNLADRQRMRLVWDRWEVFTKMIQQKKRMLESALELNKLTALHSAWSSWKMRLQQHEEIYALDGQAMKQRAAWIQRKEMHITACCQKEKESKATFHFIFRLKRRALQSWKMHSLCLQVKKKSQALSQSFCHLRMLTMYWRTWSHAFHHKRRQDDLLCAAGLLAIQSTQRRALQRWKAYVTLFTKEHERNQMASQHHHRQLLRAGLQGLSLNIKWNKTHRLNKHIAVQHYNQTMKSKFWNLCQNRLEESEDKTFQPLRELTYHSEFLLSIFFHHWREELAERRHMQALENLVNIWFADALFLQCFNSWVEFTLQKRLYEQAEEFNQQRQYTWVFYTWWCQLENHKDLKLSEQMKQGQLQRPQGHWKQQTEQMIINESQKQMALDKLDLHRQLHKRMTQWKGDSTEIRDRRNEVQETNHLGDLCNMRLKVEKWKKKHQQQMLHKDSYTDGVCRQQQQDSLRNAVSVSGENPAGLKEVRLMERQTQNNFHYFLQLEAFLAWRKATTLGVLQCGKQRGAVVRAQRTISQVPLLCSPRRGRRETREARIEQICIEKAKHHHESKLLSTAMKGWNEHHNLYHKHKVMKRKAIFLHRMKMYQAYFEQWEIKLHHRRRVAEQTERALWHWSLTLQAKVFYGWRLWVIEQCRKQEQAAQAAQVYRDQLLREGVTTILTYAADMNDLTTSLMEHSLEQKSRQLQTVVKRCAMHWKQRVLCKSQQDQEVKGQRLLKNVTFCLSSKRLKNTSQFDSAEQDDEDEELRNLLLYRMGRLQSHRHEFRSPLKIDTHKQLLVTGAEAAKKPSQLNYILPDKVLVTSTHQSTITSNASASEPHTSMMDPPQQTHVLLPPSTFMSSSTKDTLGKTGSPIFRDDSLIPTINQHSSEHLDSLMRASNGETVATDPSSTLMGELLSIQLDMKAYQEDRKQLRAWHKLKDILLSWLQTSGKDDQREKNAVCHELKELEERIDGLSTELAKRKQTMPVYAERIRHLQIIFKDHSVFTTLQQLVLNHQK